MTDPIYCPIIFGAPCMKPEVWAAWWQAILSAAAILAAARLAATQERRQLARRADVYVSLLDSAAQAAEKVRTNALAGYNEIKSLSYPAAYRLTQLGKALDSSVFQELPDCRLLPSIQSAAAACHSLSTVVTQIGKLDKAPTDSKHIEQIYILEDALVGYFNEAAAIANEHHVTPLKQALLRLLEKTTQGRKRGAK